MGAMGTTKQHELGLGDVLEGGLNTTKETSITTHSETKRGPSSLLIITTLKMHGAHRVCQHFRLRY